MKTQLTKDIEQCALNEFSKMGVFLCPEVGINIRRYGFSKKFCRTCKLTEQEMLEKGWRQSWHTDLEIVDLLSWEPNKNIWRCFEIKISYTDFKSCASKTFIGNYNYYIIPEFLLSKVESEIPKGIGIYIYKDEPPVYRYENRIQCIRKSKKQQLGCTEKEINYGMIKSLYRESKK